jgi:hypothetical protein
MTLIGQLEDLIDRSRAESREPLLIRVMPEKLAILEADADARQVLGRGTIFGIPYEPHPNANGHGVTLIHKEGLAD